MKKLLLSWSSGKDSAWALQVLREHGQYEVAGLLTTINSAFDRVAMHGTRRASAASRTGEKYSPASPTTCLPTRSVRDLRLCCSSSAPAHGRP